jgi:Short C-terminal domain
VQGEGETGTARLRGAVAIFLSLGAVSAGLTMLWLGMRSVMDIGGFCAEGGPFVIEHHCPKGVAAIMPLSIWGGVIAGGIYVWQTIKHKVPSLVWLFWPALFISLGWNFLQYGISPPDGGGLVWGWLVCAVLFILMGAIPLLIALPFMVRAYMKNDAATMAAPRPLAGLTPEVVKSAAGAFTAMRKLRKSGVLEEAVAKAMSDQAATASPAAADDIVSRLERLDALHRSGALDDSEYEAAKRALLQEEGTR